MSSSARVAVICAAAAMLLSSVNSPAVTQASAPNMIVILADDVGVNDLGTFGRAEHRTR